MFSSRPNYNKLQTNLRLSVQRLKILEKKKTELALKARKEIADYILAGKEDRARIRVEHIIREDYLVEAMEIIEMFCDLLLARFGLITTMAQVDPGLQESIASIIWVTPRLMGDIPELQVVTKQLKNKYSQEFVEMCQKMDCEDVNPPLKHRLSMHSPPKALVENYMVEIARTYNVPFQPDQMVLMGEDIPSVSNDLIELGEFGGPDRKFPPPGGPGNGGGSFPVATGHQPVSYPSQPETSYPAQMPQGPPLPQASCPPPSTMPYPPQQPQQPGGPPSSSVPPPLPSVPPAGPVGGCPNGSDSKKSDLPSYNCAVNDRHPSPPPAYNNGGGPNLPMPPPGPPKQEGTLNLPQVPGNDLSTPGNSFGASAGGEDVDFDDLTRRFEELKKRK